MTEWIGETFTSDAGWNHLETLVDIGNRMAGSDGEREAAAATRDALAEVGARDAHLESFPIQGWTRGDSGVRAGETVQDSIALPRSPAGEVTGELVDVGHGLPEDFEDDLSGKVVMAASDVPDWYDRYMALGLRFLASLHPLGHDVRQATLAEHLQDVLAIKLPIHQYVIDVNHLLSRVQEVLNDF